MSDEDQAKRDKIRENLEKAITVLQRVHAKVMKVKATLEARHSKEQDGSTSD